MPRNNGDNNNDPNTPKPPYEEHTTSGALRDLEEAAKTTSNLSGALKDLEREYNPDPLARRPRVLKGEELGKERLKNNTQSFERIVSPTTRPANQEKPTADLELPNQSTTPGLQRLQEALNSDPTSTATTLDQDIQAAARSTREGTPTIATPPPAASTTATSTTIAAATTNPYLVDSTTSALEALSTPAPGGDPLLDPYFQRPDAQAAKKIEVQEQSTFSQVISDYVTGDKKEKSEEEEGTEEKKRPRLNTSAVSKIPRPNSVKTYSNLKRGAKSILSNLGEAITDQGNGTGGTESSDSGGNAFAIPQGRSSSFGGSNYSPTSTPERKKEGSSEETSDSTDTEDDSEETSTSGRGGRRGGGLFRGASKLAKNAKKTGGALSKLKYAAFGKYILLAIAIIILFVLILNLIDSTNKTLTLAQTKSQKVFFEYFKITQSKPFLKKDGLLNITEIDSLNFEYQLREINEYLIEFGNPTDPIVVVDLELVANICLPSGYTYKFGDASNPLSIDSDQPIRGTKVEPQIIDGGACTQIVWRPLICNGSKCVSNDEKLIVPIKFDKPVPQQAFGDGTRVFVVSFGGKLNIKTKNGSIEMDITPPVRECYDMSLGAGTSDYSVSCDSPTNVANAGTSDSPTTPVVGGSTPQGCPFFAPQGLNCTSKFRTIAEGPNKPKHLAVDYQPVGRHPEYAVKSPITGIARVLYDTTKANACGQSVEILSPNGVDKYQLHHLNPNSSALSGLELNSTFEIQANGDLGNYFYPGEGSRNFPGTNTLCWNGPHIHFVHEVNNQPIDSFDEIEKVCNIKLGKVLETCIDR